MLMKMYVSIDGHLCRQIEYQGRIILLDALNRTELRSLTRQWIAEVRS